MTQNFKNFWTYFENNFNNSSLLGCKKKRLHHKSISKTNLAKNYNNYQIC
jgi:hypothetical protein